MKSRFFPSLILVLAAFSILFTAVACQKKTLSPADTVDLNAPAQSVNVSSSTTEANAFVLKAGAGLWTLAGAEMTWKDSLSLAQSLESSEKTVKGSYKGVEYELNKVKLESGLEGYVINEQLALGAQLAVVTSNLATLYKEPKDTAVLGTVLPVMNIVAVWPAGSSGEYYKILAYDQQSGARYADRYLSSADISLSDDDVNAALLLIAVKELKNSAQKKKLLSTITSKYPSSAFGSTVQEILIALDPSQMGTYPIGEEYRAKGAGTIREVPSVYGSEVKKLAKGDACYAEEATSEQFTINGSTASWIRVSKPAAGWVFGDNLEPSR